MSQGKGGAELAGTLGCRRCRRPWCQAAKFNYVPEAHRAETLYQEHRACRVLYSVVTLIPLAAYHAPFCQAAVMRIWQL